MRLKWLVPAAGLTLAATAAAQDYTPAPAQIQGEIAMSDDADGNGRRYDDYPVELVRGQRITITASPAAGSRVVPGIEIFAQDAASPQSVRPAEPETRIARLAFTAPASGTFTVRIVSGSPAAGRYTLAIRSSPSPAANSVTRNPARPTAPVIGGAVAPSPVEPPGDSATAGPRSRFIICPGHPRCPR